MGRVLITGGSGFIGRAVVPLLAGAGHEVHAVQRSAASFDVPRVTVHRADLLDPDAPAALVARVRPTHLVHLAWDTRPGRHREAPEHDVWVDASLRLLVAFATWGGRRAVVAGTGMERVEGTRYGDAKRALLEGASVCAATTGLSLAWPRIQFAYGPHESPERLVPSVVLGLLARRPVDLSDGRQQRDYVFVDDVASAVVALVASEFEGAADVGTGEAPAVRDVAGAIADRLGGRELLRFGVREDDGGPPVLRADPAPLREGLGWQPRVPLDEGIERTIRWWRGRA